MVWIVDVLGPLIAPAISVFFFGNSILPEKTIKMSQKSFHFCLIAQFLALLFTFSNAFSAVDKSGVSPNVISLPSGPGSIEGLGESFSPQLNSGTTTYSIGLQVPPGRAGFQPDIALRYNGGLGTGVFGTGWSVSIPFIQRQTDKGLPKYDGTDQYIHSGGEELVPIGDNLYRHEIEGAFVRYEWTGSGWVAKNPSGTIFRYGVVADAQVQQGGKVFQWLLQEMEDTHGNRILLTYKNLDDSSRKYIEKIGYNNQVIQFEYEPRPDALVSYRPTFPLKTAFRCRSIGMFSLGRLVRRYDFSYMPNSPLSLLSAVTQIGADGESSLPPAEFSYTRFDPQKSQVVPIIGANPGEAPPSVRMSSNEDAALNDMNSDGLPDLLVARPGAHEVFLNQGTGSDGIHRWGDWNQVSNSPGEGLGNRGASLADITGDGKTDFIAWQSYQTYFIWPNLGNGFWGPAETFADNGNFGFDFENPAVRLIDIDHDRHIDAMYCNGPDDYSYFLNNKGMEYQLVLEKPGLGMTFDTEPGMKLADMNGDRLQDIVLLQDGICKYWPAMGRGNWAPPVEMTNPPASTQIQNIDSDWAKLILMDVNGDGLTDIVYAPLYEDRVHYWLNQNSLSFSGPFEITGVPVRIDTTRLEPGDMNGNGTTDLLWNFPESADWNPDHTWQYLEFCPEARPNLLNSVSNGIGKTITFQYSDTTREFIRDREAGNPWRRGVPVPVTVLSSFSVSDGRGNRYQTELSYHDGYYDGREKEFRGFNRAEKKEVGDETIPDLTSSYEFDTGAEEKALKGKPLELSVTNGSSQIFYREIYDWQTRELHQGANGDDRTVLFAFQEEKRRTILEKGNGEPVTLRWEYQYDDYGNMVRNFEHGRLGGDWNDERITETVFSSAFPAGRDAWILNQVVETEITDSSGARASHQRNYYDNLPLGEVDRGLLTRSESWIEGNRYVVTVRNDYDEYGNLVAIKDALFGVEPGHWREIDYDGQFHAFPVQERIYTGDNVLNVSATYDFGLGVMTSSTGFNGFTTIYGYDTFGRLARLRKPLDAQSTVEYSYALAEEIGDGRRINWVETRTRDNSPGDGFLHSRTFYDGLGRKIMTRSEGEKTGQMVVTDTLQFNARKLPWKTYLPYFETGTLDFAEPVYNTGYTEHFYDGLGREIRANQPVGPEGVRFSTTEYRPLTRIVRDEEQTNPASKHYGCAMRYIEDGLLNKEGNGRLREVHEIVKLTDVGRPLASPTPWKTVYEYDTIDKLTQITDSQQNQKFMSYDGLGRKTFMNDPDRGKMFYKYDNAGNVRKTTDAKGQVIRYEYDGVNRLTAEYHGDPQSSPTVAYHYDAPYGPIERGLFWRRCSPLRIAGGVLREEDGLTDCDINEDGKLDVADAVMAEKQAGETVTARNCKGYLAWIEDESGEEHTSYDERGRVEWVVKRIDAAEGRRNFFSGMEYDSMDRITKQIYPDQSYIEYIYNTRGMLESVPGVIEAYDFNPAGQHSRLSLACGVETTYAYDHRLRLSNLRSLRKGDGVFLQDLAYSFDGVSNITGITDGRSDADMAAIGAELEIGPAEAEKFNSTQFFDYDSLYRLIRAENPSVYGTISYRYDRIGNMVSKEANLLTPDPLMDLGAMYSGGAGGTFGRVGRNAGDPPGPHAVTGTEKGLDGPMLFDYDANGNMTRDRGMAMRWDAKDRLRGVSRKGMEAEYTYDYSNIRKRKFVLSEGGSPAEEVLYVDKFSEVRDGKLLKYLHVGNSRVAKAESDGAETGRLEPDFFFLHDHLANTNFGLKRNGRIYDENKYHPFGKNIFNAKKTNSHYSFNGKEYGEENYLYYFEQRFYSPIIGKFISIDPYYSVINSGNLLEIVGDPKTLNTTIFPNNNPIVYSDFSGLRGDKNFTFPRDKYEQASFMLIAESSDFDVLGHGSILGIFDQRTAKNVPSPMSAVDLAKEIYGDPRYKGQNVRLWACNTGRSTYAQDLANELSRLNNHQTTVYAPNSEIRISVREDYWYTNHNRLSPFNAKATPENVKFIKRDSNNNPILNPKGKWITFSGPKPFDRAKAQTSNQLK
jgi:RHS repeat-associated protein